MMNVEWSPSALHEWENTARYIANEFGRKAAKKFEQKIAVWEKRIAENPEIAPLELLLEGTGKDYRGLIVGKHNKLIYHVVGTTLHIADLWDTRREPTSLTGRL